MRSPSTDGMLRARSGPARPIAAATWVVSVRDGTIDLVADAATADVTARAPTSDLLLLLWRRVDPNDVEIEGDRSALERFLAIVDLS